MTGFGGFGGGFDSNDMHNAQAASHAQSSARSAHEAVRDTEQQLERLAFICQAMWSLLREQTNLSEQDLLTRMQELQEQDKATQSEQANSNQQRPRCPECGRTFNPRHDKCLYCGTAKPLQSAFDLLQ
jgi:ribosomal protein S27AE